MEQTNRRRMEMEEPPGTCAFCSIVRGEGTARIIFEDAEAMAFLDARLFSGHCLLIPKSHYETMFDLPEDLVGRMFIKARRLAKIVQEVMNAEGALVAVNNRVSQSVPHLHIHIVPRRRGDRLRVFFWPRFRYESQEQLNEVQKALSVRAKNGVF